MSPLAAALTTLAIFVGSAAVVSAWRARRQLAAAADRAAYQAIRNPLGYPPEGHLCLICLGYFATLEPPDFKLCVACRRWEP